MFKVVDNILKVFNHDIALEDGSHDIYYDPENDSIVVDPDEEVNFPRIGSYTYSAEDKKLSLTHYLEEVPNKKKPKLLRILANTKHNNNRIGLGPIYDEPGENVATYQEGIPVDFNYNASFISTMQVSTYMYIGGRVCNSSVFFGVSDYDAKPWTARGVYPCINPLVGVLLTFGMITLDPAFELQAMAEDTLNWVLNSISYVYQPYAFRRYTLMQINDWNLFSFFIKDEGGQKKEYKVSPLKLEDDSTTVPNVNWKMSTFNLLQ